MALWSRTPADGHQLHGLLSSKDIGQREGSVMEQNKLFYRELECLASMKML